VGRQIALTYAAHGAAVVVNDFRGERARKCRRSDHDRGGAAIAETCDVTNYASVEDMVSRSSDTLGRIDILVNNAGNAGKQGANLADATPFWESEPDSWTPWIGTNFYGVMHATRAVLPGMVAKGHGRIITMISDAGRVGEPHFVVYGGAKAAAAGFSRGLAKAVGRHGVTVNCISLATVRTPGVADFIDDENAVKRMLKGYLIKRPGEPSFAANMALFLASDAASWITGQTYPVNGTTTPLGSRSGPHPSQARVAGSMSAANRFRQRRRPGHRSPHAVVRCPPGASSPHPCAWAAQRRLSSAFVSG